MNDFMTNKITHQRVLTIAVPILISNSTIPILGAVDTAVIGQCNNYNCYLLDLWFFEDGYSRFNIPSIWS